MVLCGQELVRLINMQVQGGVERGGEGDGGGGEGEERLAVAELDVLEEALERDEGRVMEKET